MFFSKKNLWKNTKYLSRKTCFAMQVRVTFHFLTKGRLEKTEILCLNFDFTQTITYLGCGFFLGRFSSLDTHISTRFTRISSSLTLCLSSSCHQRLCHGDNTHQSQDEARAFNELLLLSAALP